MTSKMSGLSVARLIFACFLSSCCCPTLPVTTPVAPPGPGGQTGGISEPTVIPRGNCLESKGVGGGGAYDYCYYTLSKPLCTTALSDCQSQPPSGKCSTTNPVPNPPPC